MSDPRTITRLLHQCREDADSDRAFGALIPLVYDDLRQLARRQLRRLRPGQTIDTTSLAHESYLKLRGHADLDWQDRRHFYAVASRAMRQILVDYARRRTADKRSAIEVDLDLERAPASDGDQAGVIVYIDELLGELELVDEELVRVVECRYFVGLSQKETADTLDLSVRTVQRRWEAARALLRELDAREKGERLDRGED